MSTIQELGSFLARERSSAARIGDTPPAPRAAAPTNGAASPANTETTFA